MILITRFAGNVHLDVDAVFTGEIGFTVFNRVIINGVDMGTHALWRSLIIFIINSSFVAFFYKELQVTTFDPKYAASIGIPTTLIHYGLMTLTSLTAVGSFESVGSILVVGLMVGPALTGFLLSDKLHNVIVISLITAIFNAIAGVYLAYVIDLSYAGVIAVVTGVVAFIAFLFSPRKSALKMWINRRKQEKKLVEQL